MKNVQKTLISMLVDPVATKRLAAAVVIAELAPSETDVLEALRHAAESDADTRVRRWVAEAIGAIGPTSIVSDLEPLLSDPSAEVRSVVKNVLARSNAVCEADMGEMLAGTDLRAQKSAIAVLGAMGTASAQTLLLAQIKDAKSKLVSAIIDALRPAMADNEAKTCKHIVSELNNLLRKEDHMADPEFAMVAVQLLSHGASFGALEVLMKVAAKSDDLHVRIHALETVQRIAKGKHPKVFESLLDIAEDEQVDAKVRTAGLNALENLDIPMTMDARVRGLTTVSLASIRRWSIKALGGTDNAPAAETLAGIVRDGVADDREQALAALMRTSSGKVAAARLLGSLEDTARAEEVARVLRALGDELTQDVRSTLEKSVMEAIPEVGQLILGILKRAGGGDAKELVGDLLERAILLKNKRKYSEAASMLVTLCQGIEVSPDARFNLGVCELKLSKRKIVRGPNHDPCLATIGALMQVREFSLLDQLTSDKMIDEEDLYYLGFSMAERNEMEKGLGGDLLVHLMESSTDKALRDRAANKLKTMGWIE
jgi:HEAT repeat protein